MRRPWPGSLSGAQLRSRPPPAAPELTLAPGRRRADQGIVLTGLGILAAFSAVLLFFPVRDLLSGRLPLLAAALGWLGLSVATALHVYVVVQVYRRDTRLGHLARVALVEATLLLLLMLYGPEWVAVPLFGLSDLLLVTSGRRRLLSVAGVGGVYVALSYRLHDPEGFFVNILNFTLVTAFCYGMAGLVRTARELDVARAELARAAINQERLRVARDLHDTLGRSMSVALLKLELAERLGRTDPARAAAEMVGARELVRTSMQEMQAVVEDMRDISLRREIDSASSLLSSAGIDVTVSLDDDTMDGRTADTLGWVVREATTNVLRHSKATRCRISLTRRDDQVELLVANNGAHPTRLSLPSGGNGIRSMRERMAAAGGALSIRVEPDGEFALLATAPSPARRVAP